RQPRLPDQPGRPDARRDVPRQRVDSGQRSRPVQRPAPRRRPQWATGLAAADARGPDQSARIPAGPGGYPVASQGRSDHPAAHHPPPEEGRLTPAVDPRCTAMIETHELTKMYGELYALNRLNLTLHQGDVYGFIGPNGAGKTTTMRILATLLNPSWGE